MGEQKCRGDGLSGCLIIPVFVALGIPAFNWWFSPPCANEVLVTKAKYPFKDTRAAIVWNNIWHDATPSPEEPRDE